MKIKHMICDWDETIVHTLPVIKSAYDHVCSSFNMNAKTAEEIRDLTSGRPKSEVFSYMMFGKEFENGETILKTKNGSMRLSAEQAEKTAEQACELFYKYIKENHLKHIDIIEGAVDFLDFCKEKDIKLYILSSKSPSFLEKEVKALGLKKYFKKVYGSPQICGNINKEEIKKLEKPNVGAFEALFNGKPPKAEECCVIGDGTSDFTLSQNIGCANIIINESFTNGIKNIKQAPKKLATLLKA